MTLGVNPRFTISRYRVCCGGSIISIICRIGDVPPDA
jgi:hypothetical protein